MKEMNTPDMVRWLDTMGGDIATAIRDRLLRNADEIAILLNDRDNALQQAQEIGAHHG